MKSRGSGGLITWGAGALAALFIVWSIWLVWVTEKGLRDVSDGAGVVRRLVALEDAIRAHRGATWRPSGPDATGGQSAAGSPEEIRERVRTAAATVLEHAGATEDVRERVRLAAGHIAEMEAAAADAARALESATGEAPALRRFMDAETAAEDEVRMAIAAVRLRLTDVSTALRNHTRQCQGMAIVASGLAAGLALSLRLHQRAARRRQAGDAALRESQRRYEDLVNTIDGVVMITDARTYAITFVSRQVERMLGFPAERWVQDPTFWASRLHPEDREWAPAFCKEATQRGEDHQFEYRMIASDGRTLWLRDNVTVVKSGGTPVELHSVIVEVTESKRAEERVRRLNRELDHRVKNNLAVVAALAERTASEVGTLQEFRDSFLGRVRSMARAHALIAERNWANASVREVLERVLGAFMSPGGARLALEGPETTVTARQASALGMVLHELATNAAKHGAWSAEGGAVGVSWDATGAPGDGKVRLKWRESGTIAASPPGAGGAGFGSDLIREAVEFDLQGSFRAAFEPAGLTCEIEFPRARAEHEAAPASVAAQAAAERRTR